MPSVADLKKRLGMTRREPAPEFDAADLPESDWIAEHRSAVDPVAPTDPAPVVDALKLCDEVG